MVRFVIHGGYGKTATTFLQENIFPHLSDVLYLGKFQDLTMRSDELRRMYDMVFPSFFGMGIDEMHARNTSLLIPFLGDVLIKEMKQSLRDIVLLSNDCLFDYVHHNAELNQLLLLKLFRYLHNHYEDNIEFRVMMTIRNQKEALKSLYAFDFTRLKDRFDSFEKFIQYGLQQKHQSIFGGFHYDLVLEDMQYLYGSNNVRFFVYEKMKEDIEAYLYDMFEFITTAQKIDHLNYTQKVNANSNEGVHRIREVQYGFTASLLVKMYRRNKSILEPLERINMVQKLKGVIEPYCINSIKVVDRGHIKGFPPALTPGIEKMYKDSNGRLAQMLNIELEEYGYVGGQFEGKPMTT